MSLATLLDDLDAAAVQLWVEDGQLRFRAPPGTLTGDLKDRVVAHKSDIMAVLASHVNDAKAADGDRFEPFPQTPIQQAYVVGRTDALRNGGKAANSYIEFENDTYQSGLAEDALNLLIERHDMLRTVLCDNRQQRVLPSVPRYKIPVKDLSGASEAAVSQARQAIRADLTSKRRDPTCWPLFDLHILQTDQGFILQSCVDLIILDAWSSQLFFQEWFQMMAGVPTAPAPSLRFRDVVVQHTPEETARDHAYWDVVLDDLPPAPTLPKARDTATATQHGFRRFRQHIPPELWHELRNKCRAHGVTPTNTLATILANTLSCWSVDEDVTLNLTLFNRPPIHKDINTVLGEFTNNTLLGFDGMDRPFEDQVKAAQDQLLAHLEHGTVAGVTLLQNLARKQNNYSGSLMPVVFTSLILGDIEAPQAEWVQTYGCSQTPQVTLDHQAFVEEGGLTLNWDVADDVIDLNAAEDCFVAYHDNVITYATDEAAWDVPVKRSIPAQQRDCRANTLTKGVAHEAQSLTDDFWGNVQSKPTAPAIIDQAGTLTYEQLARQAVGCAQNLERHNVISGDRVVVALPKGKDQVIAVLAIHYLNAVYVPIDPDQPVARQLSIVTQAAPAAIIAANDIFPDWPTVVLDGAVAMSPLSELAAGRSLTVRDDIAYIIFTSGTTGTPKGVCMAHGAVLNTLVAMQTEFDLGSGDRVFALSALNFDLSVFDIFATLRAGGGIVMPAPGHDRDPAHWFDLIVQHDITIWNSVPALLQMLLIWMEGKGLTIPDTLRLALVSGDWVPVTLGDKLKALGASTQAIALGGATEAAIWSNWQPLAQVHPSWASVPYGWAMPGQHYRVLDKYNMDRPDDVPGALHIGGQGLAKCYWNATDLTHAAFYDVDQQRHYSTGDFGQFWADGRLEFLGRKDHQIKLGGHRIELAEIQSTLESHDQITAAAVRLQDNTLVAYVVSSELSETDILAHTAEFLPDYMRPKRVKIMSELPLSGNGKVDLAAMPQFDVPTAAAPTKSKRRNASGPATRVLQDLVGSKNIDMNTNFFELGLSSIDLVEAHKRISAELHFEMPVTDIFTHTNLSTLEAHIASLAACPEQKRGNQ